MEDRPDTPESPSEAKQPAPVTAPRRKKAAASKPRAAAGGTGSSRTKGSTTKPTAKRTADKQAAAAKKTAAKKPATAEKAAAKNPVAKKSAAKKPAAKKPATAKKPAVQRPATGNAAVKQPATRPAAVTTPPVDQPATHPTEPGSTRRPRAVTTGARTGAAAGSGRHAVCASITGDMVNDLLLFVVGAGVPLEPLETQVALPAMGQVAVRLALTVTGATVDLRAEDDGRVRIVVVADGDVSTTAQDYEGEQADAGIGTAPTAGGMAMPVPPAPIPVRVEALARPAVELRADDTVSIALDVRDAELVSLRTDDSAPVPEGVDPAAWSGILTMFGMLFGSLGAGLFETLGEHVGSVGTELGPEVGGVLRDLGVATGPADVSVASGLVTVALPAQPTVRGNALPVPISGTRVGLSMAASSVDALAHRLVLQAIGDVPLPFELEVDLGEQHVGGRLRNARVLPESFPDLRSSLRTQVRTRLLRGRLELSVQAAWLELPPVVPSFVNQLSRRLGELVSLAPIRVRFPAQVGLPVIPDSDDTLPVRIDDLRVTGDGVGIVVSMA